MAIINHGQTNDLDYVKYARDRLRAYVRAAAIPVHVGIMNGDEGMFLVVTMLGMDEADIENIPHQVDGILVMLI
jgi:hypothetical protein